MNYVKVKWIHSHADEPVWLYSELDDKRWEIRKVEVFADGSQGYANKSDAIGTTKLSIEPLPSLEEIASDSQFVPFEITRQEFEEIWARRHGQAS
jgi:hypothetical protein